MKPLFWRDILHTNCSYLTNEDQAQMGHIRLQDDGRWKWDSDDAWGSGVTGNKEAAQAALITHHRTRATMILAALPREVA